MNQGKKLFPLMHSFSSISLCEGRSLFYVKLFGLSNNVSRILFQCHQVIESRIFAEFDEIEHLFLRYNSCED